MKDSTATFVNQQQRWFQFLEKMEQRMSELVDEAIPELRTLYATDEDLYKRNFSQVQSGILGQLESLRVKASDTYEIQIVPLWEKHSQLASGFLNQESYAFREACMDRLHAFEEKLNAYHTEIQNTSKEDLEIVFQEIEDEFQRLKESFQCTQCGSPLTLGKKIYLRTYISCPSCSTQNTFEPGTGLAKLNLIARPLAEQRTAHLRMHIDELQERERTLYLEIHQLKISSIHLSNNEKLASESKLQELQEERERVIQESLLAEENYLEAFYKDWISISPDQEEHLMKRYQNDLTAFKRKLIPIK
ncbi:hypothetical protein ACFSQ3_08480 [Sphingobacterium corticis]|uniref:Uncharacterized protein n=1 Tax=Sphingobacterium corticis TaxID=1812823 RepID=A0ABW5NMB9_9SPHI